jgi:nucleoid-associated protein YgaU
MIDPLQALQALLQPGSLQQSLFPPTSRYCGIPTATLETADARTVVYLRRRFLPSPDDLVTVQTHVVVEGDRLDNLAARLLGDPEQFWRICDANGAMRPDALTEVVGRTLRITLPAGLSGG